MRRLPSFSAAPFAFLFACGLAVAGGTGPDLSVSKTDSLDASFVQAVALTPPDAVDVASYPLFFCGVPTNGPTCRPSRTVGGFAGP